MKETKSKANAVRLLRKYDKMRTELKVLEHDAARACVEYGREIGVWGFRLDHLRIQMNKEAREKEAAA